MALHRKQIELSDDNNNAQIRLCLASPVFFPTYGGSQLRFLRYLPGLGKRGIDVRIVTGTPTADDITTDSDAAAWAGYPIGAILPEESVNGTPTTRVRLPAKGALRRSFYYLRTVYRHCQAQSPDVVQLVGTIRFNAMPWLMRLRSMGIPLVYAVTITSKPPKKGYVRIRQWLGMRRIRNRTLFNAFDCIIVNNPLMSEMMREIGVTTRIEVIRNGVNLQRFHPSDRQDHDTRRLRAQLGIAKGEFMVTTVGAVMPRKGSDTLLDAWGRVLEHNPGVHLVFVGPRKDLEHPDLRTFRTRLEQLIARSGSPEQVHFVGVVDDVESYLRASELFVLPSQREGLPNSVLEAMACGVPVVITPFLGLSDDLGKAGEHYLLAGFAPDSLAEVMGRLLNDPDLRRQLATSALHWVQQTMDLHDSLDRYASVYKQLAHRHR